MHIRVHYLLVNFAVEPIMIKHLRFWAKTGKLMAIYFAPYFFNQLQKDELHLRGIDNLNIIISRSLHHSFSHYSEIRHISTVKPEIKTTPEL